MKCFRLTGKSDDLLKSNLRIVVTPVLSSCQGGDQTGARHVFHCGHDMSRVTRDHCVSGQFVCDGHVNCLVEGSEASDENLEYCENNNKLVNKGFDFV